MAGWAAHPARATGSFGMMHPRLRPWLGLAVAVLALTSVAATVMVLVGRKRGESLSPDGVVDSSNRSRPGSATDRGTGRRYAINIGRLRDQRGHEPAVEYLTYIQSRRGGDEREHLLFVRHEDLDQIAALEGEDPQRFLQRLQRLGVVISVN